MDRLFYGHLGVSEILKRPPSSPIRLVYMVSEARMPFVSDSYAIFFVKTPFFTCREGQGILTTPYDPSFYGIFLGHISPMSMAHTSHLHHDIFYKKHGDRFGWNARA